MKPDSNTPWEFGFQGIMPAKKVAALLRIALEDLEGKYGDIRMSAYLSLKERLTPVVQPKAKADDGVQSRPPCAEGDLGSSGSRPGDPCNSEKDQ